ncbi:MAG: hypothetical protein GY820_18935 [Gammaproteobacteria bacterium]|nr:hypothetical protein [Gammaproteobacteria bacterium]
MSPSASPEKKKTRSAGCHADAAENSANWPMISSAEEIVHTVEAAKYLFSSKSFSKELLQEVPPTLGVGVKEGSFLIDVLRLKKSNDVFVDCYGKWGQGSGSVEYFVSEPKLACVGRGRKFVDGAPPWQWKIFRYRYSHPDVPDKAFQKRIFIAEKRISDGITERQTALICYK